MSGVFHMLPTGTPLRHAFKRLDHAAIFILIAGTFTPIHTIMFKGPWRWGMLAFIWTVAILGICLKSFYFDTLPETLGVCLYIAMGWVGLASMILLAKRYGVRFMLPMLFGGIAYTIGAVLDIANPPPLISAVIRAHEIFHVAVLAGLACHWRFVHMMAGHPGIRRIDPLQT